MLFIALWNDLAGLMADGNVAVIEGVRYINGVRVGYPFVDDERGGCSGLCFTWNNCFEEFGLAFGVSAAGFDMFYKVCFLCFCDCLLQLVSMLCMRGYVRRGRVSDSTFVEFVLLVDLLPDCSAAPALARGLGRFLMLFAGLLDCKLYVVEVL